MDADDVPPLLAVLMRALARLDQFEHPSPPDGAVSRGRQRPTGRQIDRASANAFAQHHTVHTRALELVRIGAGQTSRHHWRRFDRPAGLEPDLARAMVCALRALTEAVHAKDPYTKAHCERVSLLGESIAHELGLPEGICREVALGGLVHDVGKIGVPGHLLHKPCRLTQEEERQVRQHPVTGEEILRPLLQSRPVVLTIVRSHHERCDGTGYPDRLGGDRIPLPARIVAVADAFDAMTSRRPYRRALPVSAALAELVRHMGAQFDSTCVSALIRLIRRGLRRRSHTPVPEAATRASTLAVPPPGLDSHYRPAIGLGSSGAAKPP